MHDFPLSTTRDQRDANLLVKFCEHCYSSYKLTITVQFFGFVFSCFVLFFSELATGLKKYLPFLPVQITGPAQDLTILKNSEGYSFGEAVFASWYDQSMKGQHLSPCCELLPPAEIERVAWPRQMYDCLS